MDIKVGLNGEGGGSELMLRHVYIFTVKEADVKNTDLKIVILTKTKISIQKSHCRLFAYWKIGKPSHDWPHVDSFSVCLFWLFGVLAPGCSTMITSPPGRTKRFSMDWAVSQTGSDS